MVEATLGKGQRITADAPAPQQSHPYRWGYFQGALLIPLSLLSLIGSIQQPKGDRGPWFLLLPAVLGALVGLPLGVGILMKRKFALALVYLMLAIAILQTAIKVPVAVKHLATAGDISSAAPEAGALLVWLVSILYYRKRETQFR